MAGILQFPRLAASAPPLAQFVRIGAAHLKLGDLLAEGRLPANRVVFEASRVRHQKMLIDSFRLSGAETVLDPQTAELAALSRFKGQVRHAPWGANCEHQPLGPTHFARSAASDVIGAIARFAVEHRFDVVLAPTHFLADPRFDGWLRVDQSACIILRNALDREGGRHIAIDYPILHKHTDLKRSEVRSEMLDVLADLPADNIWIRLSGLRGDCGPLVTKDFLAAMAGLHNIGKPLILDHVNGVIGPAALAFGAASGKAHGIGELERFDASAWHKPAPVRDEDSEFGITARISVPGIGRSVTRKELEVLASARGGKKLVACTDRNCCPHGLKDMLDDTRKHLITQTLAAMSAIEDVPELRREHYFLDGPMRDAVRRARDIKGLKPLADAAALREVDLMSLMKRMHDHATKLEKVRNTLEAYHEARAKGAPRVRPVGPARTSKISQGEGRR